MVAVGVVLVVLVVNVGVVGIMGKGGPVFAPGIPPCGILFTLTFPPTVVDDTT